MTGVQTCVLPIYYTCSLLLLLVLHTYLAYIRLSIVHYCLHINIQTIKSFSLTLYCYHGIRAFPLTFWFLWTSPAFFRCPRLHPVVTVRSEPPPSRPQYLQHSDINVLRIQLPNKRHRKTKQPIPSKTQPRTARNCITRASTRRLKFLPHEHVPPRAVGICHAPHAPVPCSFTCPTHLLAFASYHVSPR